MTSECLSELSLDRLLLAGGVAEGETHVRACADCRSRFEQRRAFEREFEQSMAAPFWRAVVTARDRRRRRRWLWMALPALAGACAMLLFLRGPDLRAPEDVRVAKGPSSLEIHCRREGRTFALAEGDAVQGGDDLRFVPRALSERARFVQVASIDGTGTYTPFYPSALEARSLPVPPAGQPLEGSIHLDRAPGPERLFVVFSSTALPAVAVRAAAVTHVAALSAPTSIDGVDVTARWITLEKVAASPR